MNINLNVIKDEKERAFIKKFIEYTKKAEHSYKSYFTDFYNKEWMNELIYRYIGKINEDRYRFFGGYEQAERQMLGFFPEETYLSDFPISCLKLVVKTGIGKSLTHRDYLGALLGVGIERDKIGDIVVTSFGAYVAIHQNIADFIKWNLTSIGRYQNITVEEVLCSEIEPQQENIKLIHATVTSLRADVVLAAGFNISRTLCSKLIDSDKARCNGLSISTSSHLKEGDTATLKGYGKMKLYEVAGTNKKGKIRICIKKYI